MVYIQIFALVVSIHMAESIRKCGANVPLDMEQVTECDLSELLIKLIDGNNILKGCPI